MFLIKNLAKFYQIGQNFYSLLLECIKFWATSQQNDPESPVNYSKFFLMYQKLERLGVLFPKQLKFFRFDSQQNLDREENENLLTKLSINIKMYFLEFFFR